MKPKFAKKKKKPKKQTQVASVNYQSTATKGYSQKNVSGKGRVMTVAATAYSSTVAQCDSSPFITASGTRVHSGTIAANFLPFGTRIKIPDHFGDKVFVVEDRMSKRYWHKIDIWMPTYQQAISFGKRNVRIVILD
jgi:3D (Asp-Asp-Asp) domain-containing protein